MCRTNFWQKKERIIIIIIIIKIITRNDMIWRIINGSQFQKLWRISIHKNKIYLETKFFPYRVIFVGHFGFKMATIANQNGRHMVQHVLLPLIIHFHWNLFIFEFLTIYFDFILAAILKILKTKSTTLSDDLFLCQVSKGSAVRSEFNIFCTLATMAMATILNFFNPQKLPHTTVDIPAKFHERNPKID